jgi:hypothetical protein
LNFFSKEKKMHKVHKQVLMMHHRQWNYDVKQRDEILRAYVKVGSYQPTLSKYSKFELIIFMAFNLQGSSYFFRLS